MFPTLLRSALILLLLSLARASYYVDDSNSTITYIGAWSHYPPTNYSFDPTKIYNGTYHSLVGPGPWAMKVPFTGSGITLYIITDGMHGVNVSVDGGAPANHTVGSPTPTSRTAYNVAMFNVQGLYSDRPHNLHVAPIWGLFWFDYAIVNDTALLPPNPTVINTTAANHARSNLIGAAVGGTAGGLAVIAVVGFLLLSSRRRKQARNAAETDSDTDHKSTQAIYNRGPPHVATLSPHAELKSMPPANLMPPPTLPGVTTPTLPLSAKTPAESYAMALASLTGTTPSISNELTREHAEFLHSLYGPDVPPRASAIARMVSTMVKRQEDNGEVCDDSSSRVSQMATTSNEEPPNDEFKAM